MSHGPGRLQRDLLRPRWNNPGPHTAEHFARARWSLASRPTKTQVGQVRRALKALVSTGYFRIVEAPGQQKQKPGSTWDIGLQKYVRTDKPWHGPQNAFDLKVFENAKARAKRRRQPRPQKPTERHDAIGWPDDRYPQCKWPKSEGRVTREQYRALAPH